MGDYLHTEHAGANTRRFVSSCERLHTFLPNRPLTGRCQPDDAFSRSLSHSWRLITGPAGLDEPEGKFLPCLVGFWSEQTEERRRGWSLAAIFVVALGHVTMSHKVNTSLFCHLKPECWSVCVEAAEGHGNCDSRACPLIVAAQHKDRTDCLHLTSANCESHAAGEIHLYSHNSKIQLLAFHKKYKTILIFLHYISLSIFIIPHK